MKERSVNIRKGDEEKYRQVKGRKANQKVRRKENTKDKINKH